jgi:hypothetical protein
MARPGSRFALLACVWLAGIWGIACAKSPPPRDVERRIAEAGRGLEGDPAVGARREEVEAALAREGAEPALDEFEVRVRGVDRVGETEVGFRARVPVPDPAQVHARREVRRAETETAIARLDEVSLRRRADLCFLSINADAHRERTAIYESYARRQQTLLEWNEEWRRSGIQSERPATQFEIEGRIKLVSRRPGPPPEPSAATDLLPPVGRGQGTLAKSPELLGELVRTHHPSPAVHQAIAGRYQALSDRAKSSGRPWFEFVDLDYARVFGNDGDENEFGGQLAFNIPFGIESRADASRFRALGRSEALEGERLIQEQTRQSQVALKEFRYFEANTEQWEELLELARSAEEVADRWGEQRLARPNQLENLIDRAYDARVTVLAARERAGLARCTVLALTGVSLDDWPRE